MKKLSKLKLFESAELSKAQMKQVNGGETPQQYCCDLTRIIYYNSANWGPNEWSGADYGLNLCFGSNGYFPNYSGYSC